MRMGKFTGTIVRKKMVYGHVYRQTKYLNLKIAVAKDIACFVTEQYITMINVIADIISESVYIGNYYMLQLTEDCRSGKFLLDDIYNFMYSGKYGDWQNIIGNSYVNDTSDIHAIRLCGEEESYGSEIIINKSNFIIGKDAAQCSYAISTSNNVSRRHCVISEEYDRWYIEDLESTNGTYLNDVRIRSGQRMPIKSGDKIVIADRHYIVGDCVNSFDEDKFRLN